MKNSNRVDMVAPCGIDCGVCELYLCKENPQLFEYLLSVGISKDKIPCEGCRNIDGNCPVIQKTCETYTCVSEKEVAFCTECNEFPCGKLHPSADRANVLPHNLKVFNLCMIKKVGVEDFVKQSMEIKQRYYKGKMEIGKGPQL